MGDGARHQGLLQGFLLSVFAGRIYSNGFARASRSCRILLDTDRGFHDDHYGTLSCPPPKPLIFLLKNLQGLDPMVFFGLATVGITGT